MKGIRTILFFITIFFAVIIGFIILKLTNNYFLWIISVVIATLFIGKSNYLSCLNVINISYNINHRREFIGEKIEGFPL